MRLLGGVVHVMLHVGIRMRGHKVQTNPNRGELWVREYGAVEQPLLSRQRTVVGTAGRSQDTCGILTITVAHIPRYAEPTCRKMDVETAFPVGETAPESVFRSVGEAEVSLDEMLSLACRQGKQDIVELLLESGANVNHRNKAGNTPLLEACSQGHVSIARLLLDRRADIDAPTETTYDSALTWACTLGNSEVVELLLERNAAVEHRTKDGCTALMFAALAGHERVAKLLLDHRAEINVESDSNKDSPLTFACWKGHQKVVELFLRRKADLEHRTKEGFSPLMFAALGGHTQVGVGCGLGGEG